MKRTRKNWIALFLLTAFAILFQLTAYAGWTETKATMSGCTDTTITIKWDKPVNTSNTSTDYYEIDNYYIKTNSGAVVAANIDPNATSYTFKELAKGTVDYVTVYANYTNHYYSSYSGWKTYTGYRSIGYTRVNTTPENLKYFQVSDCTSPDINTTTPSGATGVQIELTNLVTGKKTYKTCYSFATLDVPANTAYAVRGRAYYTNYTMKRDYYGAWTGYQYFCKLTGKVVYRKSQSFFNLKLKKGKGIAKYIVYVSTRQKSGYKKTTTLKAKTGTFKISRIGKKSLVARKTYYIKIVPVLKVGGKTVNSCLPGYTSTK